MSIQTIEWMDVGTIEDIPMRGARRVRYLGATIALFRTHANEIFALEDRCPHANGPLSQGIVHDDCVTCPLHNQVISLRDGQVQGLDEGQTRHFPVRIEDERLLLGIHD